MATPNYYGAGVEDISPPSSPDVGHGHHGADVSPIDDVPVPGLDTLPPPKRQPSQRSNIPMMRRQRRQNQDAAAATLRVAKSRERLHDSSHQGPTPPPPASAYPGPGSPENDRKDGVSGRQVFRMAQGKDMRWDDMTGEPTLGSSGKSSQVKPASYAQEFGGSKTPATSAMSMLRNAQTTFGDKVRKIRGGTDHPAARPGAGLRSPVSPEPEPVATSPPANALPSPTQSSSRPPRQSSLPITRPEWKGGSGRTALVAPVQDTPQPPPLHPPRKSSKRVPSSMRRDAPAGPGGRLLSPISPSGSETSLARGDPTIRKIVPSATHSVTSTGPSASTPLTQAPGQGYPSPPHSGSAIHSTYGNEPSSPNGPGETLAHAPYQAGAPPSAHTPAPVPASGSPSADLTVDAPRAIRRKPHASSVVSSSPSTAPASNQAQHNPHLSTASSVYSQLDNPAIPNPSGATNAASLAYARNIPGSAGAHAVQPAAAVPVQDDWVQPPSRFSITTYGTSAHTRSPNPSVDLDQPPMPTPYMSGAYSTPSPPDRSRPPPMRPSPWSATGSSSLTADGRPGSVSSMSKALPAPPNEVLSANDRVGYLNARLESLANRRININKSIIKMTELMPTDNLMASDAVLRKREVEKLKVEALRAELAEVQREEYELGLKLHRAYKRQDRDAEYEPTSLWVRRVTRA